MRSTWMPVAPPIAMLPPQSWLPVVVGALPGQAPSLDKGVDAIVDIGTSKELRGSMSGAGSAVLWGAMKAMGQFAKGDATLAVGATAALVLAGTAYYAALMIAEKTTKVATAAGEKVSDAFGSVPLLGLFVDLGVLIVTEGGSASGKTQSAVTNACRSQFRYVSWGTAPDGRLLPGDIFMGAAVTNDEEAKQLDRDAAFIQDNDGLKTYLGAIDGRNLGNLSILLRELEEPVSNPKAEIAWPKAGLTAAERSVLRKLRLGMAASYKRPAWAGGKGVVKEPTDGGATLWPLYADILWTAWRQGRLPYGYLLWRASDNDAYYAHFASIHASGAASVIHNIPAGQAAVNQHFADYDDGRTVPCALLDNRAVTQLTKMLAGWDQLVSSPYFQFQGAQAADNPFHAPPAFGVEHGGGLAIAKWLLYAGVGAAGFYFVAPALALSTYRSARGLASRSASRAVSEGRQLLAKVR